MTNFTAQQKQLISSLRSVLCPACRRAKKPHNTLCYACYQSLPQPLKKALYNRVGHGYEQAFNDAMLSLEVAEPAFPST
jgi:hypothetical protein